VTRLHLRLLASRVSGLLPSGRPLRDDVWNSRHRFICWLLWAHVPGLVVVGILTRHTPAHSIADVTIVAAAAFLASTPTHSRRIRSCIATFGLVACSALLVHLSHGNIEMHFHFFVMVGVVSLYQDWVPFGTCLAFVVLHHGAMGMIEPKSVYNHPAAQRNPWLWALVHGVFVLGASAVHIVAWRLNEDEALRDPLTKLANRTLFTDRLTQALARRARRGDTVAVLYLDLDRFKEVNDTLGHPAGDQLLVEVSRRLLGTLRFVDTAARLGGDEFAILLESPAQGEAHAVGERILRELREPVRIGQHDVFINTSIGLVTIEESGSTVDDVLRNADLAMYMAKAAGRGRIECFEAAMHAKVIEQSELKTELRQALTDRQIIVHYQPTVTLDDGRIVGFEALARWHHPTRGDIAPGVFVPIAESTGLIRELGLQVLETACAQAAVWRVDHPDLEISVNVSPLQLVSDDFCEELKTVLHRTGLEPGALVLELTETVLMQDADATVARLERLKETGVRLAIDDFGTGHSSLSYLRRFPIDVLKIDRAFVESLPGRGAELAATIVRLGQLLRLDVVAEGVEVEQQRLELRSLGCNQAQGFLFSAAQPADRATELLGLAAESSASRERITG
jgi:diguanylate cyclase (GGDEF)-like protein